MTPSQRQVEKLLQHFSAGCKTPLHLKDGVCALYNDQGQEAAILEVPDQSDSLLLHCQITETDPQASLTLYPLLLQLNFEMAAMRGCWLALDEMYKVRLCFQHSLTQLDEATFSHVVSGFIGQATEVRDFITQMIGRNVA
ncbi:type III secretion system chaperone [Erwinia psidii]|uniref:CesT family type III secretion system chaperone n=1 Tax=Erwinia psidii TaxID=69224 RepID=A0A3N6UUC7_9GAMM|nr:type III secretion system chaperone [Erwinia psidii]MCX8957625.1 CesT family type III secretion system chaperone [Erwinia psidii]MCX8960679.1 CesT family type III secretion system chaperone [Erwinia psidii]MCX8964076.1 CesT family type III secretion system chaperone [Erwinia psidii]RQM39559.1 CesT family type III secretion system chaperone [Erwinia psidii]